jgi:hypothetical protein
MGGTVAFGKIGAIVQCAALTPFGWSLAAANVLSIAGVVLSIAAIYVFLMSEGFNRFSAVACCLALAATEPFVAMANQSKYEYVTFFLAVSGLVLFARGHLLLAGLTSVLAVEVQPIGIMAPIYLAAYEASRMIQARRRRPDFDRIAKVVLGGLLGVAVYFTLHPDILAILRASSATTGLDDGSKRMHFLYPYFFEARLYRHLPELAVFAACLSVHAWRRDYVQWPFPAIASFAAFLLGFALHWGNYYYVPFWYFPSFLIVFLTVDVTRRAVVLPALVLLLFLPQYAMAYVEGRKYADQDGLQAARSSIAGRGTDLSRAHIFGDFIFWPVFKDLSFAWSPSVWMFRQGRMPPSGTNYLICSLDPPFNPSERACADQLPTFGEMQLVDRFAWADRTYLVYERRDEVSAESGGRTADRPSSPRGGSR